MKRINNFFNEYKWIFIVLTISIFIIYGQFIFTDQPFYLSADQFNQYNIFYKEWIDHLKLFFETGTLPMYSWNSFLGSDLIATQSYYTIGDIFVPIVMMFSDIDTGLLIVNIILVYISSITMNSYLKYYGIEKKINRNFCAIIYAICGSAIFLNGQYMFLRFYALTPIIFTGIEVYLNKKSPILFILSIFLLTFSFYYFMYQTTLFILLYGIFTTKNRNYKNKDILFTALKLLFFYLVGVLMSSVLLLPSVLAIISNPRVGSFNVFDLFWEFEVYIGFIVKSVTPYFVGAFDIFFGLDSGHDSQYSLFMGILPIVAVIAIFFMEKMKYYRNTLLVLVTIIMFKPLSSIMHGFSEPSLRWTILLVFFMLLTAAKSLDNYDKKLYDKSFKIIISSTVIALLIAFIFGEIEAVHYEHLTHIAITLVIIIFNYIIFNMNKKIGMILVILHLSLNGAYTLYSYSSPYENYEETINVKDIDYHASIDEDLIFRYYIDHKNIAYDSVMNLNKSLDYNYMSVTGYNTIYDSNIIDFLSIETPITTHIFDLNNPDMMPMLGVKYYIVQDESELPENYEFTYAYNLNHLSVYELNEYKGFGYSANNIKSFKDFNDYNDFNNTIFVNDDIDLSQYENVVASTFDIYERGNNHLKGYIYSETNNILMLPIPNNSGWKVINNYEEVETISVNGGFIGIPITSGDNNIEMYFVSNGFELGLILTGSGITVFIVILILEKRRFNEKIK